MSIENWRDSTQKDGKHDHEFNSKHVLWLYLLAYIDDIMQIIAEFYLSHMISSNIVKMLHNL